MFDEVKGFQVTFKRLFKPNVTIEYPEEKRHMAPRYRGLPSLRADPDTGEAYAVRFGLAAIKKLVRTSWQRNLEEELDLQRDEMRRLGFTPQRPRPRETRADPEAQAAFKKGGSPPRWPR